MRTIVRLKMVPFIFLAVIGAIPAGAQELTRTERFWPVRLTHADLRALVQRSRQFISTANANSEDCRERVATVRVLSDRGLFVRFTNPRSIPNTN